MLLILRWLGNAGFEFQCGLNTLLIDPFLTRIEPQQIFFGRVAPDKAALQIHVPLADHIMITHTHFDHGMDAPEIAQRTAAVVHGSKNTCNLMHAANLPNGQIHLVSLNDCFSIKDIRVSVLAAAHPWIPGYTPGKLKSNLEFPLRLQDYRMDECFNFLIDTGEIKILIWSSTSSAGAPKADILTCRAVSSQRWYNNLLKQVNPRLVIPQHWDDFMQPLDHQPRPFYGTPQMKIPPLQRINLQDFENKIKQANPKAQVLLPIIFQPYDLESCLMAA